VIIGGQQTSGAKGAAQTYVILTASVADGVKAAAAPAAGPVAVLKVFTLSHARASDVLKAIRPILEGQPIIFAADERTNSIIAQGIAEQLDIAAALIQKLDES
jgi:type II secretory pathway component GspD/PulD (secretin)